ncbi:hypothetical protein DL98DRAFT_585890 [Cadophora sp. DSE1049]|nr:hypothetical protein DL98DRAFT_585890 [Cadophora sp. DSE1049]
MLSLTRNTKLSQEIRIVRKGQKKWLASDASDASDEEKSKDSGRFGMFIFVDKAEDETGVVDVIAIHGLNGHYRKTWTAVSDSKTECNWLADLLPQKIPNARIMSYGYNSIVQFSKSTAGIGRFADGLLEDLMSWRRTPTEKARPIIFICHSLGGLVFKAALIRARERDRYTYLLKKIRGVAFFGTPHKGSSIAFWADLFANLLQTVSFGTSTNRRLTRDLHHQSEALADISRSFVDRSKALKILSFYESDKMKMMPQRICRSPNIVTEESAVLFLPNETAIMINGDHRTMCRFSDSDKDAQRYRVVWTNLETMAIELINTEVTYLTKLSKAQQTLCGKHFYRVNYESFRNRNRDRAPMTCEWLLQHPKPGCGKSVLAKFLIEHLRHTNSEMGIPEFVCHFFFKDDNESQKSSILCLNALLQQIFKDDELMLRHAFRVFEDQGVSIKDDFHALWQILSEISHDPESINLICVLDGLDECELASQLQLLKSLSSFYSRPSNLLAQRPYLKFIIFSRPENSIKSSFSSITEIRLRGEDETEAISKDVERVINHSIDELGLQGLPNHLLTTFQAKLVEGADRTFLWTTLIIQLFKEASTDGVSQQDLQMLLENRDLYVLYNHLLGRSSDPLRARKLLQIILAATRPLTLDEINIALSILPAHSSLVELSSTLKYPCENYIKSLCGHFIRIIRSKVYLVHLTAKEFLLQQGHDVTITNTENSETQITQTGTSILNWQHSLAIQDSERILLMSCVSYLKIFENEDLPASTGDSYTREQFLNICRRHRFLEYATMTLSPLRKGFVDVAIALLKHEADIEAWDMSSRTPLHLAVMNNKEGMAELLLKMGANPRTFDSIHRTPLLDAAARSPSYGRIIDLLLKYGIDIDERDEEQRTDLHLAVETGDAVTVNSILALKPDATLEDSRGETALKLIRRQPTLDPRNAIAIESFVPQVKGSLYDRVAP